MPTLTALTPDPRDPSRVRVEVDGQPVAVIGAERSRALGLEPGLAWDPALADRLTAAEAFEAGMRELNQRPLSRTRLCEKLRRLGHAPGATEAALAELERVGALDDAEFGRASLDSLTRRESAGPRLLVAKLEARGIETALAESLTAAHVESAGGERAIAERYARQAQAKLANVPPEKRARRLYTRLVRRGFDPELASEVMETLEGC